MIQVSLCLLKVKNKCINILLCLFSVDNSFDEVDCGPKIVVSSDVPTVLASPVRRMPVEMEPANVTVETVLLEREWPLSNVATNVIGMYKIHCYLEKRSIVI